MARIHLDTPPELGDDAVYGELRSWLLRHFFYQTCAYCLTTQPSVTIDHFAPQSYDPTRLHDPTNLLPACWACNGNGGKGDYHPLHTNRRRLPKDTTGHAVIDVRNENLAEFYRVEANGELSTHDPATADRAAWIATTLLKLDRPALVKYRERLLAKCDACAQLLKGHVPEIESGPAIAVLLKDLAEQWVFVDGFDIPVDPLLKSRVLQTRAALNP